MGLTFQEYLETYCREGRMPLEELGALERPINYSYRSRTAHGVTLQGIEEAVQRYFERYGFRRQSSYGGFMSFWQDMSSKKIAVNITYSPPGNLSVSARSLTETLRAAV